MINNKVGTNVFVLNENDEKYQIRTAVSKNPELFAYDWEQRVTNGLGYLPVRKSTQETKTHTTKGLREHLKNMYHISFERGARIRESLLEESHQKMIMLENVYNRTLEKLPTWIGEAILNNKNLK